jgi:hypothetical protein
MTTLIKGGVFQNVRMTNILIEKIECYNDK